MTRAYLGGSGIVLLAGDEPFEYDSEGVRWQWNGDEPWSPSPAPRTVTGDRANGHGSWDATKFYGSRRYALEGLAHAPSHEALHAAKERFAAACGLSIDFRCVEPGGRDRTGHFRRDGDLSWTELTHRIARFSVPLWARDPRVLSTEGHTASTAFPSSTGGLIWPATWPATWAATAVFGEMELTNSGNEPTWPVYRIDGPVTNPFITNPATGLTMHFDVTLVAGQWLTVNTDTHQVLADGDPRSSRRQAFWGDWFGVPPGSMQVRFGGDSAGPGALLSAVWHDTYI